MSYVYTCPVCWIAEEDLPTKHAAERFRSEHRILVHHGSRPLGDRITQPEADYALSGKTIVSVGLLLLVLMLVRSCGIT